MGAKKTADTADWKPLSWDSDWRPMRGRATITAGGQKHLLVGKPENARTDQWQFVEFGYSLTKYLRYIGAKLGLIHTYGFYPQQLEYSSSRQEFKYKSDC